jgi:hypothetical protein
MTEEMNQAPVTPCPECPWRVSNRGRPVPEKFAEMYSRENRVEHWSSLRAAGGRMGCHLTTPDPQITPMVNDPEWIAMGYQAVPPHARPRECGGFVAAGLREMRRLAEAGSWEAYRKVRPQGLTREAAELWARRLRGEQVPGFPPLRPVDVDDSEINDSATEDDMQPAELLSPVQLSALVSIAERIRASLPDLDAPACSQVTS